MKDTDRTLPGELIEQQQGNLANAPTPDGPGFNPTIKIVTTPQRPNALPGIPLKLGKVISIDLTTGNATAVLSDGTPTSDVNITGPTPVSKGETKQ